MGIAGSKDTLMRFLSFIPFFRARRAKTIKINRVRPAQPNLSITFHSAAALTVFGSLTGGFVLLGLVGGAAILEQSRSVASPAFFAILLSAHTCAAMFALNRSSH
jgi:hypothetical protein